MPNNGTVAGWSALTSSGNATNVVLPTVISAETTTTSKTTQSALGVGLLRKISVAANLIVGYFPDKSFCVAGDRTALSLPATTAFTNKFSMTADSGTSSAREWTLVANPYVVSGGDGVVYAALGTDAKAAFDAYLQPTRGTRTLEQMIALALDNTPADNAAVITFDQNTNTLQVCYGTEANLDTYKALVAGLSISADKEVVGCEFTDILTDATGATVTYLE